jgi:hypothetical protein
MDLLPEVVLNIPDTMSRIEENIIMLPDLLLFF